MHPEEVVTALHKRPFVPFRLHVADGSSYDVRHPELLMVTMRAAYIGVPPDPPGLLPARAVVISLGHVSRLEELPAVTPPGNGQQET